MTNKFIAMVLVLSTVNGQEIPSVDGILDAHARAIGDKAAWDRIQSQTITADYEEPGGATGKMIILVKRPDRILRTLSLNDETAVFRSAVDGRKAWGSSPGNGVEVAPAPLADSFVREARFDRHWRLKELYPNLALVGSVRFSGRDHHILESKDADGVTERFYFAKDSGLLNRRETVIGDGSAVQRVDYYFDEYADFDGLRMPSVIRRTTQSPYVLRVVKVENNTDPPDSVFRMPETR